MTYTCFKIDITDSIAHIQLNRPDALNTMIPAFWNELPQIVRRIDDEALARVIVLTSTGKHFSAGMDLAVFADQDSLAGGDPTSGTEGQRRESFRHQVRMLQRSFNCLDEVRMPVLVAIQGGCIGGAVDMTSACDIRYATANAFFCIQEINIGMTADVGTFPRLCHLIPQGWLRELAYTGRRLPAAKAKEIGLVNDLFDTQEDMLSAVMETAHEIASKAPLAVTGSKTMINYARDHSIADSLDYIATWQAGMFQPTDLMESFTAKGEGRAAQFADLSPLKKEM